jgi:hypothetical protein
VSYINRAQGLFALENCRSTKRRQKFGHDLDLDQGSMSKKCSAEHPVDVFEPRPSENEAEKEEGLK